MVEYTREKVSSILKALQNCRIKEEEYRAKGDTENEQRQRNTLRNTLNGKIQQGILGPGLRANLGDELATKVYNSFALLCEKYDVPFPGKP